MAEKKIKILHIEDEDIDHLAVRRAAGKAGLPFDIDRASSVGEGLEMIKRGRYDLLLCDYLLPDGIGLEILEKVKDVPAIFITGSGDETVAVKALKGGAYDYLIKDPQQGYLELLVTTIEKVLRTFRMEREHKEFEQRIVEQNSEMERLNIELKALYEETKALSLHDPLTGLANRRLMQLDLERGIAKAKRYDRPLSVVMLDVDHFKRYNDSFGHPEGDRLLATLADILKQQTRDADLVARYGGEEFIVILPETPMGDACEVSERLRRAVEEQTDVTISLGVASLGGGMEDAVGLIRGADEALYRAKESGRNRVERADTIHDA